VAAFVLAAIMIGAGIAQRTVFQGPNTATVQIEADEDAPYLLIDGAVLGSLPGTQTLRAQGEGEIFAAYGRTADMTAWLSTTSYNHATLNSAGETVVELVDADPESSGTPTPAETDPASPEDAAESAAAEEAPAPDDTEAPSPVGSDLWLDEFAQSDVLIAPLQLPADMSVLVSTDGEGPAPADVAVSWPIGNGTPWAGPLIAAGGVLMAVGVFLYILGIRHARRSRGPRRKGLPLPVTEPIDLSVDQVEKGVISSTPPTRRAVGRGRRGFVVVPALAVSAILLGGCSADAWPELGESATPSPTPTIIVPEGQQSPAVTKAQAERILVRVAETTAEADEAMDATLAATRLEDATLAARETNYRLRGAIADFPAPSPILTKPLEIVLPQMYDDWPRSFMAVVDDESSKTSSIMVMTQADPWAPYKLSYQANLEASTTMPDLAAPYVGAARVAPDSAFLIMAPDQLAAAYADVVDKGEESEFAQFFESEDDQFRATIAADRQKRLDEFNQTATNTGEMTFEAVVGEHPPFAILTLESGAIVAVNINETDTVKAINSDAVIKFENNPTVKTLTGVDQSATGVTTTYSDQLFFYVPGQGSTEKIRLLGFSTAILDAKVIN
jgi:hypothetical protein